MALCVWLLCFNVPALAQDSLEISETAPRMSGKIAITFDDLPAVRSYETEDRYGISESILSALKEHGVKAAGFVIGDNIDSDWEILAAWLDNGHALGSHTFSHHDLHNTRTEIFIEDMIHGASAIETFLAGYGQKRRYFRFPYLHYGRTPEVRGKIEALLKDNGHIIAHVSVDTDDYLYNLTMEKYRFSTDTLVLNSLRDEYIEHILDGIQRAEALGRTITGRSVKHILLLHANRLNARFLGDLLSAIEDFGFEFVSFESAVKDKVYRMKDNYYGPKGLSKLERIARSNRDYIPQDF